MGKFTLNYWGFCKSIGPNQPRKKYHNARVAAEIGMPNPDSKVANLG